jgi:surface antigen
VGSIAAAAPVAAHAAILRWEPSATQFWSVNAPTILSVFQNGQCTELAANKRPDVVQAIIEGFISSDLAQGQTESIPNLNARYWLAEAKQVGLPTGHKPRAGALVVFQPRVLGAGPTGHVAYVQRVNRSGSFRIAQMHAPNLYQVTHQTLPASATRLAGVSFVY